MSDKIPIVYGSFEHVVLPEFTSEQIIAKVDTGAYSGAIHCTFIEEVKRDGARVLRFSPLQYGKVVELTKYRRVLVRSSTGHQVKRYIIETDVTIRGTTYRAYVGLSDRKDMQYEMLIGRRFLAENNILVDVRINQELDKGGGVRV